MIVMIVMIYSKTYLARWWLTMIQRTRGWQLDVTGLSRAALPCQLPEGSSAFGTSEISHSSLFLLQHRTRISPICGWFALLIEHVDSHHVGLWRISLPKRVSVSKRWRGSEVLYQIGGHRFSRTEHLVLPNLELHRKKTTRWKLALQRNGSFC